MPRGVRNTPAPEADAPTPAEQAMSDTAPTARPTVRRPTDNAMEAFRRRAAQQAERLPSVTIRLDEGQFLSGLVRKVGTAYHAYGDSPVVEFVPGTWSTDTPVTYVGRDKPGQLVEDVPEDHSAVFVGVGVVGEQLRDALPGDKLYIARHADGENASGQAYANLEFLAERNGVVMTLKEHTDRARRAGADGIARAFPGTVDYHPDEEPFGSVND